MRLRGDHGQVGGMEGLVFGFLVFVLGTLVVANAWGVVDAKLAAAAAAREATRAFVESRAGDTSAALVEAEEVARKALAGYGRDPEKMRFFDDGAALVRCARVTIRIEYPVPMISIPLMGRYGDGFTARARHSEIVDPFRSGLQDRGQCPPALQP